MIPDRSHIHTEQSNPASSKLDALSIDDAITLMNNEDARALAAVQKARPANAQAVRLITTALSSGGRLVYVGAGTSGRLGVLDAAECPPTFCSDSGQVVAIIACGDHAL